MHGSAVCTLVDLVCLLLIMRRLTQRCIAIKDMKLRSIEIMKTRNPDTNIGAAYGDEN
jgi:hypothetical protein